MEGIIAGGLHMKHYIIICLLLWLLPEAQAAKPKVPGWYTSAPADTVEMLYGIGKGLDKTEAIRQALGEINNKILVTISTSTTTERQEVNQAVSESYSNKVQARGEAIQFRNYQVQQSAEVNAEFYVLVAVAKREVLQQQQEVMDGIRQQIQAYNQPTDLITRLGNLLAIMQLKPQYETTGQIIRALGGGIAGAAIDFRVFQDELTAMQQRLRFTVTASNRDPSIVESMGTLISKAGFKLRQTFNPQERYSVLVQLQVATTSSQISSNFLSKSTVTITLLNNANDILRQQNLHLTGSSTIGEREAYQNSLKTLANWDFLKLLGLQQS